ncbi:MAG: PAS domain-containing protein [Candidatus Limnocylindrales bacterium]
MARIGSYSNDLRTGRWVSSRGLDAIFGIGPDFDRSAEGWASLVHPDDRGAMLAYYAGEVVGRGAAFDRRYRVVRPDTGEVRWVHGLVALERAASGQPVRMFGTIADITEQVAAEADRALLEDGLRRSEQNLADAQRIAHIGSWERDLATGALRWSDESYRIMGLEPGSFGGTLDDFLAVVHPDDRAQAGPSLDELEGGGVRVTEYRIVRPDGAVRVIREEAGLVRDANGSATRFVGTSQDITELAAAREERARLDERLRRSERNLAEAQRMAHIGSWEWDLVAGTAQRSDELHRIYGVEPGSIPESPEAFLAFIHPDDRARVQAAERAAIATGGHFGQDYRGVRPDGSVRNIHEEGEVVLDDCRRAVRMIGTVRDVTDQVAAAGERARLAAAVEHASESVVITGLDGTIEYVNPAFERMSGYADSEVVGRNPRILKSGRQSASFYRALWRRLAGGASWSGRFFNRRADGSQYEVEATISPIRGAHGEVNGYVGVERDVTALQAARSSLASEFRERAQVAAALSRLQPAGTAEATAAEICDELIGLPSVDVAAIVTLLDPGHVVTLAVRGPDGLPMSAGRPLPAARAAYLQERAAQGPWAEVWRPRHRDGAFGRAIADLGIRAMAYAPIRNGEGLLGLIAAGTRDADYVEHMVNHLPAVSEFAATASALLSGQLEGGRRLSQRQAHIDEIIAARAFWPVFQPILDLTRGGVVAHEALTRFVDGVRPDHRFAEAWAVDRGAEMELATLAAAIAGARRLPPGPWLEVNASPRLLAEPERVRAVLAEADRPIVVEITEHETVPDYGALRGAIERLGATVRIAVDDAGAGIANFAHIVELRPHFVKLDISLVRDVDTDIGRQALVMAMRHFATAAGCRLIAEGVETRREAETIASLGVELGQGYWYGEPEPIPTAQDGRAADPHGAVRADRGAPRHEGAASLS